MEIQIAPTGKLVKGSILDVNPNQFEAALKRFDEKLYLKWNPSKNGGYGLWEIRRQPSRKSAVFLDDFMGGTIWELKYFELPMIHHILDVPVLHYGVLDKLHEMDTWRPVEKYSKSVHEIGGAVVDDELWEQTDARDRKELARNREDTRYLLKENKKYLHDFREYVRSGMNPGYFFAQKFRK